MKLGLGSGGFGSKVRPNIDLIRHAEQLGFDSVWTAEAYGSDAVSLAAWILAHTSRIRVGTAIMQIPARTPAMAAMTAMTLDQLSGGRFILGVGPSGPQVVEGWHGVPYGKPLTRTREYIAIIRKILAREAPLEFRGEQYQIPYTGPGATGLGKPLKSILHGNPHIPLYTAAISPAGLRCAGEVADGVFPMMMDPDRFDEVYLPYLTEGFRKAGGGKDLSVFDVVPAVSVIIDDDVQRARDSLKPGMALYIGGMGAREKNFYNDLTRRLGFESAAAAIQDHFLSGRREQAAAAVPDELVDAVHLVGPAGRIRERLQAWKAAGQKRWVDTMQISTSQREALELLAEEIL